jgi:hypothetical protein
MACIITMCIVQHKIAIRQSFCFSIVIGFKFIFCFCFIIQMGTFPAFDFIRFHVKVQCRSFIQINEGIIAIWNLTWNIIPKMFVFVDTQPLSRDAQILLSKVLFHCFSHKTILSLASSLCNSYSQLCFTASGILITCMTSPTPVNNNVLVGTKAYRKHLRVYALRL